MEKVHHVTDVRWMQGGHSGGGGHASQERARSFV